MAAQKVDLLSTKGLISPLAAKMAATVAWRQTSTESPFAATSATRFQADASRKPPTSCTARKALLSSIDDAPGRRAARRDDDICGA